MHLTVARVTFAVIACLPALAQAKTPLEEAEALAEAGDFKGAAAKYREAYSADPRAELMCNVGVAYYKAADFPHAFRFLEQCLASGTGLDAGFRDTVKQVVTAVETKLAAESYTPIDIAVEPATATTTIETNGVTEEAIVGSRRAWIAYGTYKLTIHAEGFVDKVISGKTDSHTAIEARTKLAVKSAELKPVPAGTISEPSKGPAIVATTFAATGVVSGVIFFVLARGKASDAGKATDETDYTSKASAARAFQHASWVGAGVGGVAAIAAGYLWYRVTTHSPSSTPPVEVTPTATGATVSIGFSF